MNESKPAINTDWIDEDDVPELTDDFFERADEYQGQVLIRRGNASKMAVKLNLDADIIAAFKASGEDWQNKMNDVLREWVKQHSVTA